MDISPLAASLFMLPIITYILMDFLGPGQRKPRDNQGWGLRGPTWGGGGGGGNYGYGQAQWGPAYGGRSRGHGGRGQHPQVDLCEVCGKRPKYVEWNGLVHPYCGRTCARASRPACKYPACNDSGKSTFSGYCGPMHARDAVRLGHAQPCAECKKQPRAIEDLCLGCNNNAFGRAYEPRLKELALDDPKASSLVDNFTHLWKGTEPVKVGKIFEIRLPADMIKRREAYNAKLAATKQPRQIQTFHSAQCICDLGTDTAEFCEWPGCGICAIITSGFTSFEFGARSNSGQFGSGVYSYLEPSLADKWAVSTTSSPYRVMLACEVNLLPPKQKPPMFSSLCQSQEKGSTVYVSGADAITPQYLVLYSKGKHPAAPPPRSSPSGSSGHDLTHD